MLVPLIITNEDFQEYDQNENDSVLPSKTYKIDFDKNEIYSVFIDDEEAIKQFILKSIKTIRDQYLIYSSDFGSEISYLMKEVYSQEYLEMEVPRLIDDAILIDDRIERTENYKILRTSDELHIAFTAVTNDSLEVYVEVIV